VGRQVAPYFRQFAGSVVIYLRANCSGDPTSAGFYTKKMQKVAILRFAKEPNQSELLSKTVLSAVSPSHHRLNPACFIGHKVCFFQPLRLCGWLLFAYCPLIEL